MELRCYIRIGGPEKPKEQDVINDSPRFMREKHYAILVFFENFSGFQLQDRHNVSLVYQIKPDASG